MKEKIINLQTGEISYQEESDEQKSMYAEWAELRKVQVMEALRYERNLKLAETDWMLLSDTAEMSDAWKTYRQALRDLPVNTSDPENPTWPTKPS
jgi:hypothetical protein